MASLVRWMPPKARWCAPHAPSPRGTAPPVPPRPATGPAAPTRPRRSSRPRRASLRPCSRRWPGSPPTPEVAELAAELGWTGLELAPTLDAMERSGLIERWSEAASIRVLLSAVALARLGLRLAPKGDRWNPDRPPVDAGRVRDQPHAFVAERPRLVAVIAGPHQLARPSVDVFGDEPAAGPAGIGTWRRRQLPAAGRWGAGRHATRRLRRLRAATRLVDSRVIRPGW